MRGLHSIRVQMNPSTDSEGQQEKGQALLTSWEMDEDGHRMTALQALFSFTSEEMRQVGELPTIMSWCRHLETCVRPLLADEYGGVWSAAGLPPPTVPSHCWPLFASVSRAVAALDESYSMQEVWESVRRSSGAATETGAQETGAQGGDGITRAPEHCMMAVFAILCWGSMMVQPQLKRSPSGTPCLTVQQLPARHEGLKMDFVYRPIPKVFFVLNRALAGQQPAGKSAAGESTMIFVSTINYHSLRTIGKVRLKWVDNLSSHLSFNPRTRDLSLFRFPSFCGLSTIAEHRGIIFEELVRAMFPTDDESVKEPGCSRQLSQEVLMSYRLLFGHSRAARKLGKAALQTMQANDDYDQLLDSLCTRPHKEVAKKLPRLFWPVSCRGFDDVLHEDDSYSARDDFPMLGARLAAIQEYNLKQQPSKLRDLWRDRRNPLQWYTFWAVLVVGGLSILLGTLQLVAAVLALVPLRG